MYGGYHMMYDARLNDRWMMVDEGPRLRGFAFLFLMFVDVYQAMYDI